MPTPTTIYSLPFFTIEQMRAVAGVLRAYINDVSPTTNDAEDYTTPADLAEVSATWCHLDAAIDAHDTQAREIDDAKAIASEYRRTGVMPTDMSFRDRRS